MELLGHLDFWLAAITIGFVLYYLVWKDRVRPLLGWVIGQFVTINPAPPNNPRPAQDRPARRRRPSPVTLRRRNGQFRGSVSRVPERERSSHEVSAVECDVSSGNEVPVPVPVPISVPEIALIAQRLGTGMTPSDVAKSLPGYSSRNYRAFMEKVQQVKVLLDQAAPAPPTEPALVEAE